MAVGHSVPPLSILSVDTPSWLYRNKDYFLRKIKKEMLKYIVTGQKPSVPNTDIDAIEDIVAKVKNRKEVIGKYMQQWDRELSLKRDITREVTREVKEDDALKLICFSRKHHIPEEEIRKSLVNDYDFPVSTIDELLAKTDTKETKAVTTK